MAKKSKCAYCHECLRKFRKREIAIDESICPYCHGEIRRCLNTRSRAIAVSLVRHPRENREPAPKTWLQHYLNSKAWRIIRGRILSRDDYRCCSCVKEATQVHHISYHKDVLHGRRDDLLISICRPCHKRIHFGMDGGGKRFKRSLSKANAELKERILLCDTARRNPMRSRTEAKNRPYAGNPVTRVERQGSPLSGV